MAFIKFLKTVTGKLLTFGKQEIVEVPKEHIEEVQKKIEEINQEVAQAILEEKPIEVPTISSIIEEKSYDYNYSKRFNAAFNKVDNKFYLKRSKIKVPERLLEEFRLYNNTSKNDSNLILFWKLLLQNPDRNVIDKLFDYIKLNEISISKYGYIHGLKAVRLVKQEDDSLRLYTKAMVDKALSTIAELKAKKQAVSNYRIDTLCNIYHIKSKLFKKTLESDVALYDLHTVADYIADTNKKVVFAPFNAGPYGQKIEVGTVISMPRQDCNTSKDDCAEGLHFGHFRYVSDFSSSNEEDAVLNILVNPKNIVNIPSGQNKIRCCEYYVLSIHNHGKLTENKVNRFTFSEEDYLDYELNMLAKDESFRKQYKEYQSMYKSYIKKRVTTI